MAKTLPYSQSGYQAAGLGAVPTYSPEPAPLSAEEIGAFNGKRRSATRNYEEALAQRNFGTAEAETGLAMELRKIGRAGTKAETAARGSLGNRGLAYSPFGLGMAVSQIAQDKADAGAGAQSDKASRLAALDRMVNEAQLNRESTLAQIAADQALRQSELNRYIAGTGAYN